ncbi:MAG: response regulator [Pseudomonadota bacterium]
MAFVLIADDDDIVATLATEALIDAGHACGSVPDGVEAWSVLQNRRPDLLLLDQNMPGMSGASLLRKIRQSEKLYDLPVIMFTALSGARDEEQAIYAGAHDYIRKPFDPRKLANRIERLLDSRGGRRHTDLKTYLAEKSGWALKEPVTAVRRAV